MKIQARSLFASWLLIPVLFALIFLSLGASASAQTLRVLAYETAPFSFDSAGKAAGFEIELLEYLARATSTEIEVEFVETFEEILPRLAQGDADIAAATLTITAEREEQFDFSSSYFPVRMVLIESRRRKTSNLSSLSHDVIAVMKGTTSEELLKPATDQELIYGESYRDLMDLVASGTVDVTAMDSPVALGLLPGYPELHITMPLSDEEHYGFAFPKDSPLALLFTEHLSQLKSSKIYFRLLEKHFGKTAVDMVMAAKK